MKSVILSVAVLYLCAITPVLAEEQSEAESHLNIVEPQGGLFYFGQQLLPGDPFWTIIIGTNSIIVEAEASENIITVNFFLYNLQDRNIINQFLDATPGNGFSCNFMNLTRGTFMLMAIGLATDFDDPLASDWRAPIVVIPL
jgi:hypothetical protein